jgi:hypothetical protein
MPDYLVFNYEDDLDQEKEKKRKDFEEIVINNKIMSKLNFNKLNDIFENLTKAKRISDKDIDFIGYLLTKGPDNKNLEKEISSNYDNMVLGFLNTKGYIDLSSRQKEKLFKIVRPYIDSKNDSLVVLSLVLVRSWKDKRFISLTKSIQEDTKRSAELRRMVSRMRL